MSIIVEYPAIYRDRFGEEKTDILNDEKTLRMTLRGVEFRGSMFDDFAPVAIHPLELAAFSFQAGTLCSYHLECWIPIPVVVSEQVIPGSLHAQLTIGDAVPTGNIALEHIQLTLSFQDKVFRSCGKHGWFDDELLELGMQLGNDTFLKCCHSCAFADYHPAGYGIFGGMGCFRRNKRKYLEIEDRTALMRLWKECAETVQETFLCSEFEKQIS